MKYRTPVLLVLLWLLSGCREETEEGTFDLGYDYFPLEVGRSYYYEVDSITFLQGAGDSTLTYVREDVVDTLHDNTGALIFRVDRYERKSDLLPWTIRKVLTLERNEQTAIRTEDNLRFVKLTFPVLEGRRWDGHRFFDDFDLEVFVAGEFIQMFYDWNYRITGIGEPLLLGDLAFEEVATVRNVDRDAIFERRYGIEQYARGVGLIYREAWILDTQCGAICCQDDIDICESLPWQERAEKGFIIKQRLVDYR